VEIALVNFDEGDFKNEGGMGGENVAGTASAITEIRRNDEGGFPTLFHQGNAFIPTRDNLPYTEFEI
jgi:hypothetical protein